MTPNERNIRCAEVISKALEEKGLDGSHIVFLLDGMISVSDADHDHTSTVTMAAWELNIIGALASHGWLVAQEEIRKL